MRTIIAKNGKELMELCIVEEVPFIGACAIKHNTDNGCYYTIISDGEYAAILDKAEDNGCDIFNYFFD
jgi:hypothetical protein